MYLCEGDSTLVCIYVRVIQQCYVLHIEGHLTMMVGIYGNNMTKSPWHCSSFELVSVINYDITKWRETFVAVSNVAM